LITRRHIHLPIELLSRSIPAPTICCWGAAGEEQPATIHVQRYVRLDGQAIDDIYCTPDDTKERLYSALLADCAHSDTLLPPHEVVKTLIPADGSYSFSQHKGSALFTVACRVGYQKLGTGSAKKEHIECHCI
jgi:hypothetical protein